MINQTSSDMSTIKLRSIFKDYVSSSAFKKIDGELRIIGKYGEISLLDDVFDIWFHKEPPLSERKLSAMVKNIPQNTHFTRLDGELIIQCQDINVPLNLLPTLKINRRKHLSEKEKNRLAKQLKRVRS